jgi:predicted nucleic acid-binding protein
MAVEEVVVDASALAAVLFGEPMEGRIGPILDRVTPIAPSLLAYEIANVALYKIGLYPDRSESIRAAIRLFERMIIEYFPVPPQPLVDLARDTGLSCYDAVYLWLSRETGVPLLTLDRRLSLGAQSLGLPVVDHS